MDSISTPADSKRAFMAETSGAFQTQVVLPLVGSMKARSNAQELPREAPRTLSHLRRESSGPSQGMETRNFGIVDLREAGNVDAQRSPRAGDWQSMAPPLPRTGGETVPGIAAGRIPSGA
jgi:hypothetical protein